MRFIWIILIFGSLNVMFAQSSYSKLPPAEMIMMDFSDDDEDDVKLIEEFLVTTDENVTDINIIKRVQSVDPSEFIGEGNVNVALLVPKKVIGAYANSISNAIISYLLFKDAQFKFETFDSQDESQESILQKISEIKSRGYQFVIAPFTQKGAEIISNSVSDILVFIPTVNKYDLNTTSENIIYGGIDYKRQIDHLLSYANDRVALFGDGSKLSHKLSDYTKQEAYDKIVYAKDIKNIKTNLSSFLKKNAKLKKASIFLNMPIVKSSLIASQLTQYELQPHVLLSTQVNYNPLLFKLTQYKDREFFYIANSISGYNAELKDINLVLGNSPDYNWIDYSTSIGLDYSFSQMLDGSRVFNEDIYDNQIDYQVRVEKAGNSSFEPLGDGRFGH